MRTIELTEKESAYLLVALKQYETRLLSVGEGEMADRAGDLIFVQALQRKIKKAGSER
ncbi:hypothetical protein ACFWZ3_13280 [Frateuria sp. GZRR35]|uniref:hypothetical protein n=1 Tax=Frateuria sp. GZRR35 TaxID=3351536 RepID=UPI003EDBDED8